MKRDKKSPLYLDIDFEEDETIYPVYYKGKFWKKEDVHDIFRAFYHARFSLDNRTSVYISEGLRMTPDGEWME